MEPTPLRVRRKAMKLSLEDLAKALDVSVGQMSRIERHGTTSLPHAMKLSEITDLPIPSFAPQAEAN